MINHFLLRITKLTFTFIAAGNTIDHMTSRLVDMDAGHLADEMELNSNRKRKNTFRPDSAGQLRTAATFEPGGGIAYMTTSWKEHLEIYKFVIQVKLIFLHPQAPN